ncbi:MAG: MBL fold metallo-hydrolase, partial [Bdellovibrionota bacterium]
MIQIGSFQITEMLYGSLKLDGGAMFGAVPKAIWAKTNLADDLNRIDLKMRGLLIRKPADSSEPGRNILVDCGVGSHWNSHFKEIFGVDLAQTSVTSGLMRQGLEPEDITDVILTHLHFDHAGGLSRLSEPNNPESKRVAMFPNARVYLQRRNWENAHEPNEKERASYRRESFEIYDDSSGLGKNLKLLDTSKEEVLFHGLSVEISNGHTLGLQIIRIQDENRSLVYPADLIPTIS